MKLLTVIFFVLVPFILADRSFETFWKSHFLPVIFSGSRNCSLSACDAIKIIAQLFVITEKIKNQNILDEQISIVPDMATFTLENDLQKRIRQIESRLRSVEQPIWRLRSGSKTEWNQCTSGICRCNPDTKSFTCWNANLKSVPATQVIPMNMVFIDLSRNALSTLHKDTFRGLTLLQELDISNNFLDFIPYDLFQDLDSLIQLRIQSNQLEDLDHRTFWKLRNLNLLDISKNILYDLPDKIFNHMQRLTVINLSENKIKSFPADILKDQLLLEELDMSKNEISILKSGSLSYLDQLLMLDFSWNMICRAQ